MMKVFTSPNLAEAEMLQGILEGQSIPCVVRNQYTAIATGGIPVTESWPEIWVLHASDAETARRLLDFPAPISSTWQCPRCGEENEGQFTACWSCSQNRPQTEEESGKPDA